MMFHVLKTYKMQLRMCKDDLLFLIGAVLILPVLCDQKEEYDCGRIELRSVSDSNEISPTSINIDTPIGSTLLDNIFLNQDDSFGNSSDIFRNFHAKFMLQSSCYLKVCNYGNFSSQNCKDYYSHQEVIQVSESTIFHCICTSYANKKYDVDFDQEYLGVVLQPYTKQGAKWRDYTFSDVKAMLRVTARRFSLISTYGIGSAGGNSTWRTSDASAFVPVAAAQINREYNKNRLQVFAAIWQNAVEDLYHSEIRNAFAASKEANEIFPNTVKGIIFTSNNVGTVASGQDVKKRIKEHRQLADSLGLQLGIRAENCAILLPPRLVEDDNKLYLAPNNASSLNIFIKGSVEEVLFEISTLVDFIICAYSPEQRYANSSMPIVVEHIGNEIFLALQEWFAKNAPNVTFYGQTGWPSEGVNRNLTPNTVKNLRDYWYYINQWSSSKKVKMFMFEAIDEPYKIDVKIKDELSPIGFNGAESHYGWWKRIDGNKSISYIEKYTEIPETLQTTGSNGFPIVPVIVPVVLICVAIIAVFIYWFWRRRILTQGHHFVRLSHEEAKIFMNGIEEKNEDYNDENLIALRFPYDKSHEISKDKFSFDKKQVIGSGSSGIVYKGTIVGVDSEVAFKTTGLSSTISHVRSLLSEIKLLSYIGNHDNIVKFIGAHTEKIQYGEVYLAIEYCSLGNLEHLLRQRKYGFTTGENTITNSKVAANYVSIATASVAEQPEKEVAPVYFADLVKWCYEIADAMEYISNKKIVHADLACRNILLTSDQTAKLTDFGLSRKIYKYSAYLRFNDEVPLPWRWMAPESLRRLIFSTKTDIWAFGITMWEIFSMGDVPYPGLAWSQSFANALELGFRLPPPSYATTEIYEQMKLCWNGEPNLRIQFGKLKEFFKALCESNAKLT